MRQRAISLLLLYSLALALVALALVGCAPLGSGQPTGLYRVTLVTEGDHTFTPAESVAGDLVILGGHVLLSKGSRVEGSLVLVSGVVVVAGRIDGDTWLMNGTLTLGPSASVGRNVDHMGGMLEIAPEARVGGKLTQAGESALGMVRDSPSPRPGDVLARWVVLAVLLTPLALVLAALAGQPIWRTGHAATRHPLVALALGLLVLIVVPALLVLMAFTLVLAPVVVLFALLLGVTVFYGVVSLGDVLGQWIGRALGYRPLVERRTLSAPLGTIVLLLGLAVGSFAPALEALVLAACLSLGTGAALLTGFGSRTFVPADEHQLAADRASR